MEDSNDLAHRIAANQAKWCRHYTGTQNATCKAGVNYQELVGGRSLGWGRHLPCIRSNTDTVSCAHLAWPTAEDLAAKEAALTEHIERMRERAEAGQCIHCGAAIERKVQVDRSIYAEPCGCRLGTGRLTRELRG